MQQSQMTQKKDIIQGNQEEKFIKQSLTKPLYNICLCKYQKMD